MRWKVLVIGPPGAGKTTWISTAPNPGVAACETGFGSGILSIAQSSLDFCEPRSKQEFEQICTGQVFRDKSTIAIDSLTAMTRTFIKDYALGFARNRGNSEKRTAGVPELDDYQTMAAVTQNLLAKLLDLDKHIIVTVGQRAEKDGDGNIKSLGPDLPGALYLGAPAMFDAVLFLKSRKILRNPADKKSEFVQRYFITENDGLHIAKCRSNANGRALLASEEIFDLQSGAGSFTSLLNKIQAGYNAARSAAPQAASMPAGALQPTLATTVAH